LKRRDFISHLAAVCTSPVATTLVTSVTSWVAFWPRAADAQNPAGPPGAGQPAAGPPAAGPPAAGQPAADASAADIGQIATLHGSATVTRGDPAATVPLRVKDPVFKHDVLATDANSTLGITFDDQTTFSLSANTRITVDEFVYQEGGGGNAAKFNVAVGTAAFVASLIAKTGDMRINTPSSTLGIRGTTGVVDVPAGGTAAGAGDSRIKLYPDSDGHVGQIEVFNRQGGRLGSLTQGASAFTIARGPGGGFRAVPYQVPPEEAARDRGVLRRLFASHAVGRRMTAERNRTRGRNRSGPNRRGQHDRQREREHEQQHSHSGSGPHGGGGTRGGGGGRRGGGGGGGGRGRRR
jgi:uncharacterized membrane protein YgcG